MAVCGENGAGKSTLIKALTAIHAPSAGQIRWRGKALRWASPRHSAAAGLVGSGRTAVFDAVFGLREAHGQVFLRGELFERRTPAAAISKRLLMLPEERKEDGLFPGAAVAGNFAATALERHAAWCLPRRFAERRARVLKTEKGVVVADVGMPTGALSGGNQRKVLLHRPLENRPAALLLDEPTRGVGGVPVALIVLLAVAAGAHWLLERSRFGMQLKLFGDNPRAAQMCGYRGRRLLCAVYCLSGMLAALGGLTLVGYVASWTTAPGAVMNWTALRPRSSAAPL